MAEERLQKILARAGVASRRKAEDYITAGRVRVDGQIVKELGAKADPRRARIELDGRRLEAEPLCYGILHKPRGMVTTLSDPEGRPTARDILREVGLRVVPVGRLDFNTSGALLFTNDGDFAQVMQHAKGKVPKVYAVTVGEQVDEARLKKWAESIEIEGKATRPAEVRVLRREGKKTWLEVTVQEGRNRQVRRLGEHAGSQVIRLARLSHAEIGTEGLKPGQWRLLTIDELKALKKRYGVPTKIRGIYEGGASGRSAAPKRGASSAARKGPKGGGQRTGRPERTGGPKSPRARTAKTSDARGQSTPKSRGQASVRRPRTRR